jgi:hypothetical protein
MGLPSRAAVPNTRSTAPYHAPRPAATFAQRRCSVQPPSLSPALTAALHPGVLPRALREIIEQHGTGSSFSCMLRRTAHA